MTDRNLNSQKRPGLLSEEQFLLLSIFSYIIAVAFLHWSTWSLPIYLYALINLAILSSGYAGGNHIGDCLGKLEVVLTRQEVEKSGLVSLVLFLIAISLSSVIALFRVAAIVLWEVILWFS